MKTMATEKTATQLKAAGAKFWHSMNKFNKDGLAAALCEELEFSWCEYFEESPAPPAAYRNAVYELARAHWEVTVAAQYV